MNESPTVQATSKPDDKPADSRIVLYFETLGGKAQVPEFMHLDEALDRLGVRKFPDEWGMSPIWEEAPFQYESNSEQFYKYTLKKTKEGFRLSKRKLKSDRRRNQLEQCNRIYVSVRKALSGALSRGLVKAAKLFHDGTIHDIADEQRGIWAAQMRSIFYTEYAHEQSRKFRVLINRVSFERWLEALPDETPITTSFAPSNEGEHSARKTPPSALLKELAEAVATRAAEQQYVLLRDPLSKLVRQALAGEGYDLSDRQFKIALWNNLRGATKGGRRRQGNRDAFEADVKALREIVQQQARRPNITKLITPGQVQ